VNSVVGAAGDRLAQRLRGGLDDRVEAQALQLAPLQQQFALVQRLALVAESSADGVVRVDETGELGRTARRSVPRTPAARAEVARAVVVGPGGD
jgi:hypothetical protein